VDRRTRYRSLLEPGMLTAMAAIVIGVTALVVSVIQVRLMHAHQHASVWPRLEIMPSYSPDHGLSLDVVNRGIGPAVIGHVRVTVDDAPVARWSEYFARLAPDSVPRDVTYSTISGRVLVPGQQIRALHLHRHEEAAPILRAANRSRIEICYCSVFDRCWISLGLEVRPVAACPAADAGAFRE
jgi:Co/Zn/Cd efflux system component